jgi:hypothetical protein
VPRTERTFTQLFSTVDRAPVSVVQRDAVPPQIAADELSYAAEYMRLLTDELVSKRCRP